MSEMVVKHEISVSGEESLDDLIKEIVGFTKVHRNVKFVCAEGRLVGGECTVILEADRCK